MSREKPQSEYETSVTCFGNGAKIKAYKKHIGKKVLIKVIDEDHNVIEKECDKNVED